MIISTNLYISAYEIITNICLLFPISFSSTTIWTEDILFTDQEFLLESLDDQWDITWSPVGIPSVILSSHTLEIHQSSIEVRFGSFPVRISFLQQQSISHFCSNITIKYDSFIAYNWWNVAAISSPSFHQLDMLLCQPHLGLMV